MIEKADDVVNGRGEVSPVRDDLGLHLDTPWGSVRQYQDATVVAFVSDPPQQARAAARHEANPRTVVVGDGEWPVEVVHGVTAAGVTGIGLLFIAPIMWLVVIASVIAYVVGSNIRPFYDKRRAIGVNRVVPEDHSMLANLLLSCIDPQDTVAPIAEAAAESVIGFATDLPENLDSLVDDLVYVWRRCEKMPTPDARDEMRRELLAAAQNLPRTAEAVSDMHDGVMVLNTIIDEAVEAEEQLRRAVNEPITRAALQDRELEVARDRARAKILTNRFSEIADKARLEAEVSRAVAKDMLNRDDQEKPT